ncbi:MAG TPA: hypothetical protein VFI41_05110 [Gemmatimonadales bacterium]|nr:hypothetical protein [Gemmatimonadales bacterium]
MSGVLQRTEYLVFFDRTPAGRKTQIVNVVSKLHGDVLGEIRWYGRWRQYAFYPRADTIWNPQCLDEVTEFVRELMRARRA